MSLAILFSRSLDGLLAPQVAVEVHLANGLPSFTLVGLPETEVREARDRVRAAVLNSGFDFPPRRITVNLAPADLPKESGRFDLPIALGILIASGQLAGVSEKTLSEHEFAGELSLSGELRAIRGALPMCLSARGNGKCFVLPAESAAEAALVENFCVLPARSLAEVCAHLNGQQPIAPYAGPIPPQELSCADLADVRGQAPAKRVLEVAAAGAHSLLFIGPPGTGKSMLASRLPSLLPPPSEQEALESAAMQSLVHGHFDLTRWRQRSYRAPHHTASAVALVGGGALARPGEISLADHGVLFLDELAEFPRAVLEALREPLETGRVNISRAARRIDYPARFQLICAMNPCPCGFHGSQEQGDSRCCCTPDQVARYRNKLSGPLLDRIDLAAEVPILPANDLQNGPTGESSARIAQRVAIARHRQSARQGCSNARLDASNIDQHCPLEDSARQMLSQAIERLRLSARAYHRILKVARTLADLADSDTLRREHVAEAVQYRRLLAEWTH